MELEKMGSLNFFNGKTDLPSIKGIRLVFLIEGSGRIDIDGTNTSLSKGDLFVINTGKSANYSGSGYVTVLSIKQELFKFFQQTNSLIICTPEQRSEVSYRLLTDLMSKTVDMSLESDLSNIRILIANIIDLLDKHFSVSINNLNLTSAEMVKNYIDGNYYEDLGLDDIARNIKRTSQYIASSFKDEYGVTINTYLNSVRINATLKALTETESPIVDIAMDNGFNSIGTYNRNFKKTFKINPSSYRKLYSKETQDESSNQRNIIDQVIKTKKKKSNDTFLDIAPSTKNLLNHFWDDRFNFEKKALDSDIQSMLSKLNSTYISTQVNTNNILSETELLLIEKNLDQALRKGMLPIFKFTITNESLNNQDFIFLMSKNVLSLLKHFANIVSIRNISNWKIELIIDNNVNKLALLKLIETIYSVSRSYGNMEKIIIAGSYSKLLDLSRQRLDIDYSLLLGKSFQEQRSNPYEISINTLVEMVKSLKKEISNRRLVIEDLQLISPNNKLLYDTEYFGALYVYFILKLWDMVDGIEIPKIQDYPTPSKNSFLNGQKGLFSSDGIPKPIYNTLVFLNSIGRYYIMNDDYNLVTFDGFNDFSIVSIGYSSIIHNNYNLTYENYKGIFKQSKEKRTVHYNFKSIKNGTYRIKIRRINQNLGNIIHSWGKLGFLTSLSMSELQFLKNASQPELEMKDIKIEDNQYSQTLELSPNEILYFHFIYRY